MQELLLTLVTPQKKIVEKLSIDEVYVPAYRGELGILPGHAPLMTTLSPGVLRYRSKGGGAPEYVAISWGYLEVSPTGVIVLAETAEKASEIDVDRAKRSLNSAWLHMKAKDLTPEAMDQYQSKVQRAQARLNTTRS